jgi:YcaO-like protein with predicted kinase domain
LTFANFWQNYDFSAPLPKVFWIGTHRSVTPADTVARVRQHLAAMGITRLGNITGLDRIGIPVAIAVRPNSRSVSILQGKGLSLDQAFASALMEAVEASHGEGLDARFRLAPYQELVRMAIVVDPSQLSRNGAEFDPSLAIYWIEGFDLLERRPLWVPAEIVHTDYTVRELPDSGCLLRGSVGLSSGNHMHEALSSAICEVVERDAVSIWGAQDLRQQCLRYLDTTSIDDENCRSLIDRYEAANIKIRIWDVTTEIGIATFVCDIRELSDDPRLGMRRFRGAGCHPDRGVALSRALTEAAQTRLTYIAGSRDDIAAEEYEPVAHSVIGEALLDVLQQGVEARRFGDVSSMRFDDIAHDVCWMLAQLRAAGFEQVVAVDLTRGELGIPVVRVVIPGLEGDCRNPEYVPGLRSQRWADGKR